MSDLRKYTVQEAENINLGQLGSIFLDSGTTITAPDGTIIVAITFLDDSKFTSTTGLKSEVGQEGKYINTVDGDAMWTGSDTIDNGNIFRTGITIYGRWSQVDLNTGSAILYLGV